MQELIDRQKVLEIAMSYCPNGLVQTVRENTQKRCCQVLKSIVRTAAHEWTCAHRPKYNLTRLTV